MATREQLMRALRAADAAGNTADAQQLANSIRSLDMKAQAGNPVDTAFGAVNDVVNKAGTGIYRGIGNLAGSPRATLEGLRKNVQMNPSLAEPYSAGNPSPDVGLLPDTSWMYSQPALDAYQAAEQHLPTAQQGQDFFFKTLGVPEVQATSGPGRVAQDAITAAVPGMLGGLPGALTAGLGGAAASTVREMGGSPAMQTMAGATIPLLAGVGTAAASAIRPGARQLGASMVSNITREDMTAATRLMQDAKERGIGLTWPEAFNQVTGGGAKRAADVQRVVENSTGGGDIMAGVMRDRAPANAAAMRGQLDQLGRMPQGQDLGMVPARLQAAAEKGMRRVKGAVSTASDEYYTKAKDPSIAPDGMMSDQWLDLANTPTMKKVWAKTQEIAADERYPVYHWIQVDDAGNVHLKNVPDATTGKYIEQAFDELIDGANAKAGPGEFTAEARRYLKLKEEFRGLLRQGNPALEQADFAHRQNMQSAYEPTLHGPLGLLAEAPPTLKGQRSIVAPLGEQGTLDPAQVQFMSRRLAKENPTALRDWVRVNLQSQFSEANQGTQGQPAGNQFGGAKFRAQQLGNADQAKNVEALIRSLPNGSSVWAGYRRLMEIYEAQGWRQQGGSMTEFNRQISSDLSASSLDPKIAARVRDFVQRWRYGANTEEMARMMTDPDNAAMWSQLAMLPKGYLARLAGSMAPGAAAGVLSNALVTAPTGAR